MTEYISHRKNTTSSTRCAAKSRRASGFTLIEVLVALAIFTVLLVIVFVPLTQATRYMAIGRTRSGLQQSANGTIAQMQRDLSRAIHVYPNDNLPGVTDVAPYAVAGVGSPPYYNSSGNRVGNTSRLDLLLPDLNADGSVKYPITPAKYIVTYYARRLRAADDFGNSVTFNPYNNPVVLFRAQYPYRNNDANSTPFQVAGQVNADVTANRYGAPFGSRPLKWLRMDANNEFDLNDIFPASGADNITQDATGGLVSSNHTLVTPRNVQLVLPMNAANAPVNGLKPNTTFNCADTNSDGKIDRVNINLTLMNFNIANRNDSGNNVKAPISGNPNFQRFTLSQTVNLPNIR